MSNPYTKEFNCEFNVQQMGGEDPSNIPTLVCNDCGGHQFIVGSRLYETTIKCPICLWEKIIHEG